MNRNLKCLMLLAASGLLLSGCATGPSSKSASAAGAAQPNEIASATKTDGDVKVPPKGADDKVLRELATFNQTY